MDNKRAQKSHFSQIYEQKIRQFTEGWTKHSYKRYYLPSVSMNISSGYVWTVNFYGVNILVLRVGSKGFWIIIQVNRIKLNNPNMTFLSSGWMILLRRELAQVKHITGLGAFNL